MSDRTTSTAPDRLRQLFEEQSLIDPRGGSGNAVDLIRAIASHCGMPELDLSPQSLSLKRVAGNADHLVFVLIDGLGINLLHRLDSTGFFASCQYRELRALAPSTTACVLTSLSTGTYPSEHSITGWFTHLTEYGRTCIPLPFLDRGSNESLLHYGVGPEKVFPILSMLPRMPAEVRCLLPLEYWDSTYARYWRGGMPGEGYSNLAEAVDRIAQVPRPSGSPSFTYLYIPVVDEVSHAHGPGSEEALAAAREVEVEIERLAAALPDDTRLVCTADHGQIHIPEEGRFLLFSGDPLLELLQVPPSGEDRLPLFHVKAGRQEAFCSLFRERYGEQFLLLSMDEMERMRVFGPGPMSPMARQRFGDFATIATGPWILGYSPSEKDPASHHLGRHGGLSPDEMRVPLLWK